MRSDSASSGFPRPLVERVSRIHRRLSNANRILVCSDFDGTLAPIVSEPGSATLTDQCRSGLAALEAVDRISTAIVSGRSLRDLVGRFDRVGGVSTLVGNHGLEMRRDGRVSTHPIARKRGPLVDEVCGTLDLTVGDLPGCRVENKRLTGTVHVRSAPRTVRPVVRQRTAEVVDDHGNDSLELSTGKAVYEFTPSVPWGKGDAVEILRDRSPPDTAVVYVGDDRTDESAFRSVEPEGVGVLVGEPRETNASCHVDSHEDVAALFHWIAAIADPAVERKPVTAEPLRIR